MNTSDFDYDLPRELIAQRSLDRRDESRLMVLDRAGTGVSHRRFADLPALLRPDDVLVFNDTRVIPARLRGQKPTGGRVELLLVRSVGPSTWEALVHPGLKPGQRIVLDRVSPGALSGDAVQGPLAATVLSATDDGLRVVDFELSGDALRYAIRRLGEMPTPPYVKRRVENSGEYQTVYAAVDGSIAAPTAGFHFTPELFERLRSAGISLEFLTLHIGLGTFKPVKVADVAAHVMHGEWCEVRPEVAQRLNQARRDGRRLVAVGTTTVRALESAAGPDEVRACSGETCLFIYPGYRFRVVDALITNFHLPRSTLLMLVSAFAGRERVFRAYAEAVAARYRFYSFGDAMLII